MKHKEPTIVVTSTNAKGFCGILDNLSINTDDQKKLKNASWVLRIAWKNKLNLSSLQKIWMISKPWNNTNM